jgi:hypothetical protein
MIIERNISVQILDGISKVDLTVAQVFLAAQRRDALRIFEGLLSDPDFFEQTRVEWKRARPEDVWQKFFEDNVWILGYGLQYQFGDTLADKKLQQTVAGNSILGGGKRTDALLKTLGAVNTLCFVEIKTHTTLLLSAAEHGGRSEVFAPSRHLAGATAQIQVTVQRAMTEIGETLIPSDSDGYRSDEILHVVSPRALVICGLQEFVWTRDTRG